MPREVEAKIALQAGELDVVRERLRQTGAVFQTLDDEENFLFDTRGRRLRAEGRSLRLRCFAGRGDAKLTQKGPVDRGSPFKSREELEVSVSDGPTLRTMLGQIGFRVTMRYTKRRETWQLAAATVTLDRLSFGDYLEVEADEAVIKETLVRLGLGGRPHVPSGYGDLVRRNAAEQRV